METTSDNVRAALYAVGVHVLCIALALSGMFWWQSAESVQAAGEPLEAVFIDMASVQLPAPAPARPTPPQPREEPPPPPEPEPVPEPPTDQSAQDEVEQAQIDALALLKAEEEAREQEEKRKRAEQILLEEEQKRREEEERKKREEREREQAEKEAAEAAAREQAEREAAEKAAAEQAAREAAAAAQAGNRGQDDSLLARYGAAITRAVHTQWRVPDNTVNIVCTLRIIQIPGGELLDAAVVNPCNADGPARASLERAARAAEPLPYAGFESVFRRQLLITFCHPRDLPECTPQ
jgi:colicin import membrane protein